ncbi:MAG: hypothetical protein HOE16_05475 [Lentimicrobiaceae bacterium]|jgi:hypothetical protein|nr:hypothetical protein [Lentimicrobiaceae bacterium]MBT4190631.1 hypothetical protein [Lentimicrobiaceae bacterium]MBT4801500.1 hypothetical protein [Lentimicrobiaceae bacterium]MBT5164205.1 hypothetical protein [Lentimicrobiaceae bacterium]MBT5669996.1 hypothetical protein [Lentimicrobiaceae bacterium]
MEKNNELEVVNKNIKNLGDQKRKDATDIEKKKITLQKKKLRLKEEKMKKMEHLKSYEDFTESILVGSGGG